MSFERAEMDWLLNLWETEPVPWREPVLFMYLRYVEGCIIRRVSYWTPERCCLQVRGAAKRGEWIGRRALHDVSGCGERRARNLIDERTLWADPYRPCPGLADASADGEDCGADETLCPGSAGDASRVCPAGDGNDADEHTQDGPGSVPPVSRVGSRVGPDRAVTSARDHRSPSDTFMQENTTPPAHAGPPRAEPGSTTEAPPHGPSPATPVPGADRRDRQEPPGSDTPDAPAEPATLAARGPRTRRDAGGDGSGKPDVAELYRLYRARHPRKALTATPDDRKHLARMLTEAGSPDAAALYLDWIHEADDDRARQVRGEAPWPDGRISPMLSLEELARKVGSRLPHAEAWAVRGRRSPVVSGGSAPPTMQPDEAGALWDWAMGEVKAKGRTRGAEEVFTAAEPRRARAAVVIRDLGLWSRMCDQPEHFLKPERQRFIGAFNAAQKREAM